jgi:hypothetical protein
MPESFEIRKIVAGGRFLPAALEIKVNTYQTKNKIREPGREPGRKITIGGKNG